MGSQIELQLFCTMAFSLSPFPFPSPGAKWHVQGQTGESVRLPRMLLCHTPFQPEPNALLQTFDNLFPTSEESVK